MRLFMFLLALIGASVILGGCGNGGTDQEASATENPTTVPGSKVSDALADAQDVPGCTRTGEGSLVEGSVTRSFDCSGDVRLTSAVIFHKTLDEARKLHDDVWSAQGTATDQIRRSLIARPANLDSLKVTEVTDGFGRIGADQENVWCATYTDQGGTTKVTEFYGAFRHKVVEVAYTTVTTNGATCDDPSDARQYAQTFAREQLAKLKAILP